jgi:hypothetical protein
VRFLYILCLCFAFPLGFAAEAISTTPAEAPWWLQLVWAVIALIFGAAATPWLLNRAKALREEAAAITDDIKRKAWLSLQAYALERVEVRFKRDGFAIAQAIVSGELSTKAAIKAKLQFLGEATKQELIVFWRDHFSSEFSGKALYDVFAEKYVDQLIESLADKVWSRIPGFALGSTTDNLIQGGAKKLIGLGIGRLDSLLEPTPQTPESHE